MDKEQIVVCGARVHNLKNINVSIPRDKLVVLTGLSGSGKSSLAFDTIYAEGQRRYVESLSAYARQFLGQMDKPDVDSINGLSPAIAIDQKTTSNNPRSTVGTVTEIYDYLRLLYSRIGHPHCPDCGHEIVRQTVEQIVDHVLELPEGTKFQVLAPVVRGRKGEYGKLFEDLKRDGFVRIRVDGEVRLLDEEIAIEKYKQHRIEVVVDRLVVKEGIDSRLADSLETALRLAKGLALIAVVEGEERLFSENFACPDCGFSIEDMAPRMFSFNSPFGACPSCDGLGMKMEIDPDKVLDLSRSINNGAVLVWSTDRNSWSMNFLRGVADYIGLDVELPLKKAAKEQLKVILHGTGGEKFEVVYNSEDGQRTHRMKVKFEGIIHNMERRYRETQSESMRQDIQEKYMTIQPCTECGGGRLRRESLAVTVGGINIRNLTAMSVLQTREFMHNMELSDKEQIIAKQILKEINERLGFLLNVGLDYLSLDRMAGTLSGGEAQRIRLATQVGSSLMGVLYILDEPSIGLHQRDNQRLIGTLKGLRDLGNTIIVVEHDEDMMREADHIIDIGPGAGLHGGEVVAAGDLETIMACKDSITGQYLSGAQKIPVPVRRRKGNGKFLELYSAAEHNLKKIDVKFPLGELICVTGVSGSGKSTLVNEILYPILARKLNGASSVFPGQYREIKGLDYLEKVIGIDQSPIGRTPRSNPATYTGLFDLIREVYSESPEAKMRGYKPGRFSFNVKGGRCEACAGDGILKIEMHFLPDVYVPCEVCKGKRYNRETLEVKYKGKTIADILEMQVEEAMDFFQNHPRIMRKLQTLHDVGLDYVKLGQPATTLSGGEAQRVKLATELSRRSNGKTFYILDEPTTGLHFADVQKLLEVLERLVESGSTVLVIEHNLDVIKTADYLIDLGPDGGDRGGRVVAAGTPEQVAKTPGSYTGEYLKKLLGLNKAAKEA